MKEIIGQHKRVLTLENRKNRNLFFGVGMALILLYYAILFVYPLAIAVIRSFYDWNPLKGSLTYTGLRELFESLSEPAVSPVPEKHDILPHSLPSQAEFSSLF